MDTEWRIQCSNVENNNTFLQFEYLPVINDRTSGTNTQAHEYDEDSRNPAEFI